MTVCYNILSIKSMQRLLKERNKEKKTKKTVCDKEIYLSKTSTELQ